MKYSLILIVATLNFAFSSIASAEDCPSGELRFSFRKLEVKQAFAILSDFARLKAEIDPSISGSAPMNFNCTPWEVAAKRLAGEYNLNLKIENGVMRVSRRH